MNQRMTPGQFDGNERFEVRSVLGQGGMGVVYAGWDRERQEAVAIKTLHEGGPGELLRLKTEFRALQELEHPNLVSLGELVEEQGCWFFTMELVEGEDFISYVRRPQVDDQEGRPLTWSFDEGRLRESLIQLGRGLQALHATGRVHRDIKPANVLVQADGRVVLLDFGLVTQSDPGQNSEGQYYPVGTARYMAPEQAASLQVGPEADWYSVGVLLYEALTGQVPFSGTYSQVLLAKHDAEAPRPSLLVPEVPEDLEQLCLALLQHDPARRPRSEEALAFLTRRRRIPQLLPPTSGTRMPVFVGRRAELARLQTAFLEVSSRGLVTMLVHGASGLGKSALLHASGREILEREPRTVILWGRCNERELVSYKAFDSVIDALSRNLVRLSEKELTHLLPRNVDFLARVFPVLSFLRELDGPNVARVRQVSDLQEVRSLAFQALRELLTRLTDRRPLVVFLDDIQWADEDSLKLLRALIQPPDPPAMLLVLSMRTRTDASLAREMVTRFEALFPEPPESLHLGPLSMEAAAELVRELLSTNPELQDMDQRHASWIAREAGGHPLYIHELMHHLQLLGPQGLDQLKLEDVLWSRIVTLEDGFRRLVELVSVSFGPLRQDVAAAALGCRTAEVFRTAARLRILHLVRTSGPGGEDLVEPYHDRVRDAVLARMDPAAVRVWHEAVVRVLRTTRGVEPERLAAHLECIGEVEQAAGHLAEAADLAAESLAFGRAAGLYERALRLRLGSKNPADVSSLRELMARLGIALANAGRGREASEALLEAAEGARAADALELRRKAAEQLLLSGYLDDGFEVTRQVMRSLGVRLPRTSFGALVSLLWRRLWVRLRGTSFRERDETEIPPVKLVKVDILSSIARGLALTDHIRGADFNARFLLAALRLGEPRRILSALTMEANFAATSGPESSHIRRTLAACERIQERLNDTLAGIYMESARSYVSFMCGHWGASLRSAETAFGLWSDHGGTSWERCMMNIQVNWSMFYLGELAEMTRRMPAMLQDARDRGDLLSVSGMVLGLNNVMILNQDGPRRALQEIDELMARWSVHGYHLQHYLALLARVHVLLFTGDGPAACAALRSDWRPLKRSLLLKLPSVRHETHHLRARAALLHASGLSGSPRRELHGQVRSELGLLLGNRLPWVQAVGTLLASTLAFQQEAPERAADQLRLAVNQLDDVEMKLYAAAARVRLGRLLGGDEGRGLVDAGSGFMTLQGVRDQEGMTRLLAPGFDE
jgi:eukaryotic-like serine/threonine-protein kinase